MFLESKRNPDLNKTKSFTGASLKVEHITSFRLLLLTVSVNEKKKLEASILVIT